jgi:hypothetical protein
MEQRTSETLPMLLSFSKEALLQAIPGIAYVVGRDGTILAFSRGPFMEDVKLPGAATSGYRNAIGSSLFSIVQGDQVRQGYRSMHEAAWSGRFDTFGFAYRCDAPDVERNMFMSISRIAEGTITKAVLYQSIIVSEFHRPPVPLFAFEMPREPAAEADRIVTLCSYCQRVQWPVRGTEPHEWIEAVEFYQRGGRTDAVASHGICEVCLEQIVERGSRGTSPG